MRLCWLIDLLCCLLPPPARAELPSQPGGHRQSRQQGEKAALQGGNGSSPLPCCLWGANPAGTGPGRSPRAAARVKGAGGSPCPAAATPPTCFPAATRPPAALLQAGGGAEQSPGPQNLAPQQSGATGEGRGAPCTPVPCPLPSTRHHRAQDTTTVNFWGARTHIPQFPPALWHHLGSPRGLVGWSRVWAVPPAPSPALHPAGGQRGARIPLGPPRQAGLLHRVRWGAPRGC